MLRPATDQDLDAMRTWRNHPEVRGVSLTQHEIGADEHRQWWERVKADPTRRVLIYERGEVASGVVAFFDWDREAGTAWWSYFLDNAGLEERGEMFPAWISIQRDAVRYAKKEMLLKELHAETLVSNESAADFNSRQGLHEVERYQREVDGQSIEVIHSAKLFEENK